MTKMKDNWQGQCSPLEEGIIIFIECKSEKFSQVSRNSHRSRDIWSVSSKVYTLTHVTLCLASCREKKLSWKIKKWAVQFHFAAAASSCVGILRFTVALYEKESYFATESHFFSCRGKFWSPFFEAPWAFFDDYGWKLNANFPLHPGRKWWKL